MRSNKGITIYKQYNAITKFIMQNNNFVAEKKVRKFLHLKYCITESSAYHVIKRMRDVGILLMIKKDGEMYLELSQASKILIDSLVLAKVLYQYETENLKNNPLFSEFISFEKLDYDLQEQYKELASKFMIILEKEGLEIKKV